jgi:hypothetical protein
MKETNTSAIRILTLLVVLLSFIFSSQAIPAFPRPIKIVQPDGSSLTILLHGDEFSHFTTTDDGYTIVQNDKNMYVYAQKDITGILRQTIFQIAQNQRMPSLQHLRKKCVPVYLPIKTYQE